MVIVIIPILVPIPIRAAIPMRMQMIPGDAFFSCVPREHWINLLPDDAADFDAFYVASFIAQESNSGLERFQKAGAEATFAGQVVVKSLA